MQKKASLLIVDDDKEVLETLSAILKERGYLIETAKTGKEAITKAKENFFNVALIDVKLPDVPGIEVLRAFRKKHPDMKNIIITRYPTRQNAVDALNLGAYGYITRPIDPKRVDRMIKGCLAQRA